MDEAREPVEGHEGWVLLVDDDESDVIVMTRGLRLGGWKGRFVVAHSCAQALAALEREPSIPRLMVIDQGLPGSKGLELLECIREEARYVSVPAVLTSGHRDERLAGVAERLGAEAFVEKSFDYHEYLRSMAALAPASAP